MMETFDGKDDETRAQIGYATIIRKINSSDSNTSWVYLLKNLMILDCALERRCFIEELCELELPILNDFKYRKLLCLETKTANTCSSTSTGCCASTSS